MSLIEYRNLLYEVSEKIAWITERRRLLFICKIFLPDGCEDNIQDVLSLLNKLEEEDKLGIDSLDVLKDLLERMGKWNLLHIVEKFENKRKEYKRLLEQCGRVLDECSQLERLISVCKGKISRDRQEHITDVCTLFMELEKQNNLGIERLEILKTMAVEMEKPDLLEQVEDFEKKRILRKLEEVAERKQNEFEESKRRIRSQAQTAVVLASAGYAGGKLIGIVTPHCTFRSVAGGVVVVTTWMILRRSSTLQEFVDTFKETVLPLGNTLLALGEGSLCFTVQAQTTLALEELWKTYQDGTLQQKLQDFLITEEIKQLVGSEVKLTVKIDEQEYNNAGWDLILTESQEMEVKEGMKGFEDESSSDFAPAGVKEAHPQAREEVSENTDINLPDRIAFVEEYLANLQETYSMTTETTDSGLWSQSTPSEAELYKGTEDIQELLEHVDEWMKGISKKLDILTEPGGVATRDEDILDNILQVKKEMENIRKALDTLGKPEGKTKYGGSGFTKRLWRAVTRKKENVTGRIPPQRFKESIPEVAPPNPPPLSRDPNSDDEEAITIIENPLSQKIKEGLNVQLMFKCKARGNIKLTYQWYKDGRILQGGDKSTLVLKSVRLPDFGSYMCAASCTDSPSLSLESSFAELDVTPRDGTMYKHLRDIDFDTENQIAILLDQEGYSLAGWRQVAYKYGMNQLTMKYLEEYPEAGKKTLEFLLATMPDLTVYEFCKTLKLHDIRRLDIVGVLQGHLSVPSSQKIYV